MPLKNNEKVVDSPKKTLKKDFFTAKKISNNWTFSTKNVGPLQKNVDQRKTKKKRKN